LEFHQLLIERVIMKKDLFNTIASVVIIVFLVFLTFLPGKAQVEDVQTWYATEETDTLDKITVVNIPNCDRNIQRSISITDALETPETNDYQLVNVVWKVPSGQTSCFAEYELAGENLYAVRADHGFVCNVLYAYMYCWDILDAQSDLIVYGKIQETFTLKPSRFEDEHLVWNFYYNAIFMPVTVK